MTSGRPFGFNIVGHVSANLGLGVAARHLTHLILSRGFPVSVLDIAVGLGRDRHDLAFQAYTVSSARDLPYGVNLLLFPPETIIGGFAQDSEHRSLLLRDDALNVGMIMWEQMTVPAAWVKLLTILDVVAAPSDFIRATFETRLSGVKVISAKFPIHLPSGVAGSRERFGLPKDRTLFVTSFEPSSDMKRKNPVAVIHAFRRAFADGATAGLVIKVNNPGHGRDVHPGVQMLRRQCGDDPRLRLIDEPLSYSDVLALYASCDVFVSLHRSEGLGLGLMEAMALGKPVIATGWSGNMSFMNHTNSCLVGYDLIPVRGGIPLYRQRLLGRSAVWASPNVEDAATWMARLAKDSDLRLAIGKKASDSIAQQQEEAARGSFLDEISVIWEQYLAMESLRRKKGPEFRDWWLRERMQWANPLAKRVVRALRRHVLWRFKRR